MKKKEILFFTAILVIASIFCMVLWKTNSPAHTVSISIDGKVQKQFDLYSQQHYTIQTPQGYNILQIQNHTATITEADCPDQICVKQKSISHTGEMIVCLPHKVVVEIK